MSFALHTVADAIKRHGAVARVVVAAIAGSAPREAGASMLVWQDGQSGTIGGGQLELEATLAARESLRSGKATLRRVPLGPALGQCCGGAVTLATEVFDAKSLPRLADAEKAGCLVRPIQGPPDALPLAVERLLGQIRNGSSAPKTTLLGNWLIEPVQRASYALWIYGAGHVGRAIVDMMAPMPEWAVTWVDTDAARFPERIAQNVSRLIAAEPQRVVAHAPADAHHLVLTYSHALDLELCHALLERGFSSAGLIGSATKWARFRDRLRKLGHSDASILRIACPIGDPSLGKAPQAIAVGVTALLLRATIASPEAAMDRPA
ncbi:xanthine dehydrogenase accessory protein XdhC [Aliiruegeria sabulilitoris]|uniref:xanthine dehydrogenase accessory protein XdhC n=1 Tax=Aliiruegeria sabulilitoris TaxID=1510458 RepID=UPI000830A4AA|nr:xanthine dehydrogenase accessory protein XdhC [Aliiruegeria sabulilitoris]NDR57000.1 xanthine dehydrogenase accessory protein XdhC [Pseudoruegeria sp. M32A2M]